MSETQMATMEVTYSCGHTKRSQGVAFQIVYHREPTYMACSPECDDKWREKQKRKAVDPPNE